MQVDSCVVGEGGGLRNVKGKWKRSRLIAHHNEVVTGILFLSASTIFLVTSYTTDRYECRSVSKYSTYTEGAQAADCGADSRSG